MGGSPRSHPGLVDVAGRQPQPKPSRAPPESNDASPPDPPALDLWVDVRLRAWDGRWLAVPDLADEPDVGTGTTHARPSGVHWRRCGSPSRQRWRKWRESISRADRPAGRHGRVRSTDGLERWSRRPTARNAAQARPSRPLDPGGRVLIPRGDPGASVGDDVPTTEASDPLDANDRRDPPTVRGTSQSGDLPHHGLTMPEWRLDRIDLAG